MGFLKNMFENLEEELSSSQKKSGKASRRASGPPPTRWEKAVIALSSVTTQVVKVDPDGVDIVCFGGDDDADWYRNVKHTKHLEEMVSDKRPKGACAMGAAMNEAIDDAFDKDLTKCPCAIMVLTAGRPDDTDELNTALMKAVTRLADTCETMPLTVTFVQIGNDSGAAEYLASLDDSIKAECAANGETFDLVDTIKSADIDAAMKEIKGTKSSGKNGALFGAFAGAALGVGGMYIYNKQQAKKRTKGWGGKWQVTYDGEEICVLNVTDDEAGNLVIDGLPSGDTTTGAYSVPSEEEDMEDEEFEYTIEFKDPSGDFNVEGTVEDEHAITWSDGTRWDEMDQDGAKMTHYVAAAAGGAAAVGATGYLLDKQFFNKASKGDQCDYIILMDRSAQMNIVDSS
mmetsp:Transcript_14690/g.17038  ORF Transcript_14690/g.17038 Transcript_14690/m.17038 type:complete len:400 (+) Transcript_14690:51-1250(+)